MIIVEIQEVTGTGVVLNETITTVTTSLDLISPSTSAENVTVEAHNTIPQGTLANALEVLADQFFRGPNTPSGSNLAEGDLWYDTDDDQLKVYRETSTNNFEFVPLAQATGTMDTLDGGNF